MLLSWLLIIKKIRNHFASSIIEFFVLDDFDGNLGFSFFVDGFVNNREFTGANFFAHGKNIFNGSSFKILQGLIPVVSDGLVFEEYFFRGVETISMGNVEAEALVLLEYFVDFKAFKTDDINGIGVGFFLTDDDDWMFE